MQHCRYSSSKVANSAIEQYRTATRLHYDENSVSPSVCLSNACIVTKRKKDLFRFLYTTSALVVIRETETCPECLIGRKRGLLVSYCWSVNLRLGQVAPTIRSDPLFRNTGRPDPRNGIRFAPPRRSAPTRGLELSDHGLRNETAQSLIGPSVSTTIGLNMLLLFITDYFINLYYRLYIQPID